jgi:hypothetical protein
MQHGDMRSGSDPTAIGRVTAAGQWLMSAIWSEHRRSVSLAAPQQVAEPASVRCVCGELLGALRDTRSVLVPDSRGD